MADVGCRNTVFGAEAQEASAHLDEWRAAGIRHFRLEFVHESAEQVRQVARAFESALAGRASPAQQLARELKRIAPEGTTEGSLFVPEGLSDSPDSAIGREFGAPHHVAIAGHIANLALLWLRTSAGRAAQRRVPSLL